MGVMLDAGTAAFRVPRYFRGEELQIFLTHAHLDHVVGLTYLFSLIHETGLKRVRVYGDEVKLQALEEHLFSEHLFPKRPPYEAIALQREVDLPKGGRLRSFPLEHVGGSLGFRLDWPGHSMAYVTDTTADPAAGYVDEVAGVDLLVHECYFGDAMSEWARKTGHSHTTLVAKLARAAEVKRLVLVHLNPLSTEDDPIGLDTARAIFPATQLGEDRMELKF
jgi:ribonuclease BN (tRNA processing enzyme)